MYSLPTLHVPGDLAVASRTENEYTLKKHVEATLRRIDMLLHVSRVVRSDIYLEKYWSRLIATPMEAHDEN